VERIAASSGVKCGRAPGHDLAQDAVERPAFWREPVLGAQGVLAVHDALDEAVLLQPEEAVREELWRRGRGGLAELGEAGLAQEEVADDEQRPAVADEVECARRASWLWGPVLPFRKKVQNILTQSRKSVY
jgi:hypothetical protein